MSQLQDKVRVYDAESYSPDFGEITGGSRKTSLFLAASSFEKQQYYWTKSFYINQSI